MTKRDLTNYQKKRLIQKPNCCICGELIIDSDSIILIKEKIGKCKKYKYIHTRCLNDKEY